MAASSEELEKKVDKFMNLFDEMGKQLRDLHDAIKKNTKDLREMEKGQLVHDERIKKLEMLREKDRAEREMEREMDRARISYMEDQLRRANLRLRGLKRELMEGGEMIQKLCQWMNDNGIEAAEEEIERAHWALGSRREGVPKDLIIKFKSARRAEEIFKALRRVTDLSFKKSPVRILRDFSAQTLQERKKMRPIADTLFRNSINFSWQYPATILIIKDGKSFRAKTLEEGRNLLRKFGLEIEAEKQSSGGAAAGIPGEEFFLKGKASVVDPFAVVEISDEERDSLKMRELEQQLAKLRAKSGEKESGLEQRVTRQQTKKK